MKNEGRIMVNAIVSIRTLRFTRSKSEKNVARLGQRETSRAVKTKSF